MLIEYSHLISSDEVAVFSGGVNHEPIPVPGTSPPATSAAESRSDTIRCRTGADCSVCISSCDLHLGQRPACFAYCVDRCRCRGHCNHGFRSGFHTTATKAAWQADSVRREVSPAKSLRVFSTILSKTALSSYDGKVTVIGTYRTICRCIIRKARPVGFPDVPKSRFESM